MECVISNIDSSLALNERSLQESVKVGQVRFLIRSTSAKYPWKDDIEVQCIARHQLQTNVKDNWDFAILKEDKRSFFGIKIVNCSKAFDECLALSSHALFDLSFRLDFKKCYVILTTEIYLKCYVKPQSMSNQIICMKNYSTFLCHIEKYMIDREEELEYEIMGTCGIIGCRIHRNESDNSEVPKGKIQRLHEVMDSTLLALGRNKRFSQRNRTYWEETSRLELLERSHIQFIYECLDIESFRSLSQTSHFLRDVSFDVFIGMKISLYPHQKNALRWMTVRELQCDANHPNIFPSPNDTSDQLTKPFFYLDLIQLRLRSDIADYEYMTAVRGGVLADEPGLGKTVTMITLVCREARRRIKATVRFAPVTDITSCLETNNDVGRSILRSKRLEEESFGLRYISCTLIIVPEVLVDHWIDQINLHTRSGYLKVYVDVDTRFPFPSSSTITKYDIIITSFKRLSLEYAYLRQSKEVNGRDFRPSSLLTSTWQRLVVDEGHKLSSSRITNHTEILKQISSRTRWLLTGTPIQNRLTVQDISSLHGLFVFLRYRPYNQALRYWSKTICRPIINKDQRGITRFRYLMSEIMSRQTKETVHIDCDINYRLTGIFPTPQECVTYNGLVSAIKANLLCTDYDPNTPKSKHPDSYLNPANFVNARYAISSLRLACMGGCFMAVCIKQDDYLRITEYFNSNNIPSERIEKISSYLNVALENEAAKAIRTEGFLPKSHTFSCDGCSKAYSSLLLLPCAHMICAACQDDMFTRGIFACAACKTDFDYEFFQQLQPAITYDWMPNLSYDVQHLVSGKACYLIDRILQERKSRSMKMIIFSQYTETLERLKAALAYHDIRAAEFISANKTKQKKSLEAFKQNHEINVLLLSPLGAHGLDLSYATDVVLMDEIWNKALENQVISRAYRMGSTGSILVEKLYMKGSIEETMETMNRRDVSMDTPVKKRRLRKGNRTAANSYQLSAPSRKSQGEFAKEESGETQLTKYLLRNLNFIKTLNLTKNNQTK